MHSESLLISISACMVRFVGFFLFFWSYTSEFLGCVVVVEMLVSAASVQLYPGL